VQRVITMAVTIMSVVVLRVIMLSVIILIVIMLSVVMLNVMAPATFPVPSILFLCCFSFNPFPSAPPTVNKKDDHENEEEK
jgi:hypothetical protein